MSPDSLEDKESIKSITFKILMIFAFVGVIYFLTHNLIFAIGITIMLFIHEMGHYWAIKFLGYPVKLPIFIPLLGAVINVKAFKNRDEEALMAYWGPLAGGLAALLGFFAYLIFKNQAWLMISFWATFVNLFNMLPSHPLDGGRIVQVWGDWTKKVGFFVFLAVSILTVIFLKWILMIIFAVLVLRELIVEFKSVKEYAVYCYILRLTLLLSLILITKDIFLIGLFLIMTFMMLPSKRIVEKFLEEKNQQNLRGNLEVAAPLKIKLKWSILYLLLSLGLILLTMCQLPFLKPY